MPQVPYGYACIMYASGDAEQGIRVPTLMPNGILPCEANEILQ